MELTNNSRFTIYNELVTENGVTFIESILEICSIGEADAGEYTCGVANQAGLDSVTVQITVTESGGECYLCCHLNIGSQYHVHFESHFSFNTLIVLNLSLILFQPQHRL